MTIKLTDPADLLDEMEEPIRTVRGAYDALIAIADEMGGLLTEAGVKFIASGLWPAVRRLEELSEQWAKLQKSAGEKEG
jgi:hypothetical protein